MNISRSDFKNESATETSQTKLQNYYLFNAHEWANYSEIELYKASIAQGQGALEPISL